MLENEWLEQIKKFVVDYQSRKSSSLSVNYLENLLDINQQLYQQCQTSREELEENMQHVQRAKHGLQQVKQYGSF